MRVVGFFFFLFFLFFVLVRRPVLMWEDDRKGRNERKQPNERLVSFD